MVIIPELKKIPGLNEKIRRLAKTVGKKIDAEGLQLEDARLISGCTTDGKHLYQDGARLDNCGLIDNLYFCDQHTGYCEDYYYGTLYFKTDVPGQYVAVPFDM